MQIKVSGEPGEQVRGLNFSMGNTDKASDIKRVRLFSAGTSPGFAPNAQDGNQAGELDKAAIKEGKFSFDCTIKPESPTTNLWLAYDISPGAGVNNRIDAVCETVKQMMAR